MGGAAGSLEDGQHSVRSQRVGSAADDPAALDEKLNSLAEAELRESADPELRSSMFFHATQYWLMCFMRVSRAAQSSEADK